MEQIILDLGIVPCLHFFCMRRQDTVLGYLKVETEKKMEKKLKGRT